MCYGPSLSEKRDYLRRLQQTLNGLSAATQGVARAFLLAELRWETQEIKEVEAVIEAIRALRG